MYSFLRPVEGVHHFRRDAARHLAKAAGSKLEQRFDLRFLALDGLDLLGELFAKAL